MAVWINARFPGLVPADLRAGGLRILLAFVLAHLAVPAGGYMARPFSGQLEGGVLVGVGFAAMVFLMLAAVWMVRIAQGLLGGRLR